MSELLEVALAAGDAGAKVLRKRFGEHREGLRHASLAAAGLAREVAGRPVEQALEMELKGPRDLVSAADRESEERIVELIERRFPGHTILGEEGGFRAARSDVASSGAPTADVEWVIDPLDGTTNFLSGLPIFAVSIAAIVEGELSAAVVVDPMNRAVFSAEKGGGAKLNGRPIRVRPLADPTQAFVATGFPFRASAAIDLFLELFRKVFLSVRAVRRCGAAALDLAHTAAGIYDGFFELRLSAWDVAAGALLVREAGGVVTDFDGADGFLGSGNIVAASPDLHRQLLRWFGELTSEAAIEELVPLD